MPNAEGTTSFKLEVLIRGATESTTSQHCSILFHSISVSILQCVKIEKIEASKKSNT